MRNIVKHAIIILGMVSSFDTAEYSGSKSSGSGSIGGGYGGQSGYEGSYNAGFVGEYAGHLGAGTAIGELQSYGEQQANAEHGNHYEQEESQYKDSYGPHGVGGDKHDANRYGGFAGDLDISKFPVDVEAHRYSGNEASEAGLEEEQHQQQNHEQYGGEKEYQSDDQNIKQPQQSYNQYEYKQGPYKGYQDPVGMLIVPYSGYGAEEGKQEEQQQHSGYEENQQANNNYEQPKESYSRTQAFNYESPKESYGSSYEITKVPVSSYTFESERVPNQGYSSSYGPIKATSPAPIHNEISDNPEDYAPHEPKYHYSSGVQDSPSKPTDFFQKIKLDNLKNFHSGAQKNVMTIDHGKGSYSYSSLYRA